ncbi:GAF domain-containing sensor histidine kinase [Nocardioides sp.]|uniref:sensor histidine kinase n=1 Tax=Nocardioides sp. TaxID=35761 RepID=UPI0027258799|nr:GAF domain-containing sensor histidine kinase [Nocardioides sp.]MDO9456420.1 GAF domain-containing sensor histidine kinase [Nocardioides sp.]
MQLGLHDIGSNEHSAQVLVATIERLSTATTLDRVTGVVTEAVRAALGCDGASFVLREDGCCHYADEDAISPLWKGSRFPLSSCISGWAMLHREPVVVPDIYADERIPHDAYRPTFVQSLAMVPIRTADPLGAIGAYWAEHHVADADEVRLLGVIANSAAVAIENLELRGAIVRRSDERDELAQRADELEAAVHTIVHDLRDPLIAMLGYAELLDDVVSDAPAAEAAGAAAAAEAAHAFARTIVESGRRITEQIDTMLGVYRITDRDIEPATVDLSEIARQVADQLGALTGDRHIEIRIEDGLDAIADPDLAYLMIENLLGNAVKYTRDVPDACIELLSVTQGHMSVGRIGSADAFRTFVVRDNGDGFDAEDVGRLFRPMARLHSADEFPGVGMGLASVARIVEMHGGQVSAEGEKHVGAAFYFSLPAAV